MGKTRESGDLVSDNILSVNIINDRVGIGSTLPSSKLDVDGDVQVSGAVTGTSFSGSGIGLTATVDAPDATYGSESALLQITVTDGRITDVNTHTLTTGASDIAEIVILDNDVSVGTAGTINFGSNLSVTPASAGIVTVSLSGTIDNSQLSGNISNDKLVNDSVTYGGVTLSLGSTDNTPAFDLSDATNYPYNSLTGVTTDIVGDTSPQLGGNLDINNNDIVGTGNINLTGIVTATTFSGSGGSLTNIPNSSLDNSTVSYGGVQLSLGGSDDTPAFDLSDATNYPYDSLTGISTNIVGDASPQLGGNLDVNNNNITGTGNINLTGIVTATSFFGDGSGLTGVAKTGNINADTLVVTGVSTLGIVTATSFFGDGSGLTGVANTGSINTDTLVVTGVLTATSANFSGDISIADKITHIGDTDTSIRFPSNDNFTIETAGTERVRVGSAGSIGIGTDDPSQRLEVIGNLSLVGKIIAGNRNHLNLNFDNLLDFNATTGIKAFRPINFIDTSATVKIARIADSSTLDSAVEFQTWNSTITTNTSYWDVYGGPNGLALRDRFPGRVNNRLFVGTGGNILIGSNNSSATNSSIEVNANGTDNILQVQGNTYISGDVGIGTTSANAKVHIGPNENNDIALQADGNVRVGFSSTTNYIAFHGTYLDGSLDPGVDEKNFHLYTHSFIAERVYDDVYRNDNPSSDPNLRVGQKSELLLFKGNDPFPFTPPTREPGADRIRLAAAEVHIDTYSHPIPSEDLRTIDGAATHDNLYQRLVVTGPGDVGIGTTLPTARVHIAKNTTPGAEISTAGDIALQADGNVRVGISTTSNFIAFHGTFWDGVISPGVQQIASRVPYTHTYIGERIYNYPEDSELLLYKGNDNHSQFGTDRIRYLSGMHEFQLINDDDTVGTFEEVGNFVGITTALLIDGVGETGVSTVTVFGDFVVNGDFESDVTISTGNSITGSGIGLTGTVDAPDATYGSESSILQITVSDGRITDISTHTITSGASDIAEVIILDNDVSVGTAGTINFGSNLSATPASAGIVTVSFSGTISNDQLAGSIANNKLANSSVSYGGVPLSLGSTDNTPAFNLIDATGYRYSSLTGVSTDIVGDTSPELGGNLDVNNNDITGTGNVNLAGVITATSFSGSLPTTNLTGTITNDQLAGSISNGKLSNSEVSYGGVELSLGQADPTPAFNLQDATDYRASSLVGTIANSQLAGSTSLIITSNLTLYVTTNGNDSTGDGSISFPWATPTKAAEFLSQRRIKSNVTVTVSVGSGTYTFTSSIRLDHPQGSQIRYVGATPTGTRPFGATLNGGNGGAAIRGYTSSSQSNNDTVLKNYFNTIWQFNNTTGITVGPETSLNISNILIRGNFVDSNPSQPNDGILVQNGLLGGLGGVIQLNNASIHNFRGRGLALVFGGSAVLDGVSITNCAGGCSNTSGIILGQNNNITISNNNGDGINILRNGTSRLIGSYISNNGRDGLTCLENSSTRANSSTFTNNGRRGVTCRENGSIQIRGATVTNNGNTGVLAASAGYIDFSNLSGSNSVLSGNRTATSPALNTTGNSGSFIRANLV